MSNHRKMYLSLGIFESIALMLLHQFHETRNDLNIPNGEHLHSAKNLTKQITTRGDRSDKVQQVLHR